MRFADVSLLNQDGMPVRLEKDLVGDHLVVMGFIYTSCTTVCPVVSSIMGKVQQQLGGRVGQDIHLVSISVDPQRDDAKRLQDYAKAFQKGPGWSWLTGTPYAISETLKGLGSFSADLSQHPPLILVGDGRTGPLDALLRLHRPGSADRRNQPPRRPSGACQEHGDC
ncbi:electron transport protein SCO1/SenC [Pseudomonas putida S11]|nr:electron transport protein SCO1/SenC [Pseudomonas putida S11]